MVSPDQVIRTFTGKNGEKLSFTLNSETVAKLKADAGKRLASALPGKKLDAALSETREIASLICRAVKGMSPEAARLSALFMLANEDLLPAIPGAVQEALDRFRSKLGEDVVNELSAYCQLEDWPGFFASEDDTAMKTFLSVYVFGDDGGPNVLLRESLIDLDSA